MVAGNPDEKIKLKIFHTQVVQNAERMNKEMCSSLAIPQASKFTSQSASDNYYHVKLDIQNLIEQELYKLTVRKEVLDED